jgi:pimeloyl-ACP methyl ester carboxylesterase
VKIYSSGVIDGTTFAFERAGTGPPLILVHGLGGPAMWERVAPILAARFDVIIPHLPGFGESPPASRPLTAAGQSALLAEFIDRSALTGITAGGISYGGEIAARLATLRPGRIASLNLICPTGTRRYPVPLRSGLVRATLRPILRRGLVNPRIAEALSRRSFCDPGVRPNDLVSRYVEHLKLPGRIDALLDAIGEIWSGDRWLSTALASLPPPLTLIWGEADRTIPVSEAFVLHALRPDAKLIVIPACGHSVPLESPERLYSVIFGNNPPDACFS